MQLSRAGSPAVVSELLFNHLMVLFSATRPFSNPCNATCVKYVTLQNQTFRLCVRAGVRVCLGGCRIGVIKLLYFIFSALNLVGYCNASESVVLPLH